MGMYLNQKGWGFDKCLRNSVFVDKSMLIKECNKVFGTKDRFLCVTRMRRSGKTMAFKMLISYYSKGADARGLFGKLKIAQDPSFEEHLNKRNVFCVDMTGPFCDGRPDEVMIPELKETLLEDLKEEFPSLDLKGCSLEEGIIKVNKELGERFVFLMDEWDIIYREANDRPKLVKEFTSFLKGLFGAEEVASCFDLVYLTGILPMRKEVKEAGLGTFHDFDLAHPGDFAPYCGFLEEEVKPLCPKWGMDFEDIKNYYDGYRLKGLKIYNPLSIVRALDGRRCGNFWTHTISYEVIVNYMNHGKGVFKDAFLRLFEGERIPVDVSNFSNDENKINSLDDLLTLLILLGNLAYDEESKTCFIPNKEVRSEYQTGLEILGWIKEE